MRIKIITPPALESLAREMSEHVRTEFPEIDVDFEIAGAEAAAQDSHAVNLTIVLFGDETFDDALDRRQQAHAAKNAAKPILPISAKAGRNIPPGTLAGLKARHWPDDREIILNRIGALLGLALRPGEQKVFISYRVTDGRLPAQVLEQHLKQLGYQPYLDEAIEPNTGEPNLPLGAKVDSSIEDNLHAASAVLLLDTPQASHSKWIHREVNLALGHMVPILPIVFHLRGDTHGCRFRQLQGLHRQVSVEFDAAAGPTLNPADLDSIVTALESYLSIVYQRRVVQARDLRGFFQEHNWSFDDLAGLRHRYKSEREKRNGPPNRLLSCCSFEDRIFGPAVQNYASDIAKLAADVHYLRHLYFYAGDTESAENLQQLYDREVPEAGKMSIHFLNYAEAALAIARITLGVCALDA
jgi:hypothetical protein